MAVIKVATLSSGEIDQIEDKINKLMEKKSFDGYSVASTFFVPGTDNEAGTVVFIFQKPK